MSAADKIAAARALIEPLRATVLWGNANPDVMKAAETLDALADLADAQAQEIARLKAIIAKMDANSARIVRDFYDPGVTLSEWAQRQYPELRPAIDAEATS